MGTYRDGRYRLYDVLAALGDVEGLDRVRLSSIEPTTIDDAIVDTMARGAAKLCPYLHVPLQSGDDGILARMRRRYTSAEYLAFMEDVVARVPGVGLGTDVMVGFPGEDEAAFSASARVVERLPFTNVHVFSFSARPRTSACGMDDPVPTAVIRERSARMHRLAEMRKADAYAAYEGTTLRVLFEERRSNGLFVGFSDNYVKVCVESDDDLSNRLIDVRIGGLRKPSGDEPLYAAGETGSPLRRPI
jgi:threonylcarbamoyladenosine tRNA methylthiotransferase MtaB